MKRLNKLSIDDQEIFIRYLTLAKHELSVYSFVNIYIWKGLFDIRWAIIEGSLCVFLKDKIGCFLYLAPLGERFNPAAITEAFEIMDSFNSHKQISRVENVEQRDLADYRHLGYDCIEKSEDYVCGRDDLVQLKGGRFKSKRSAGNYFLKHYNFECAPFSKNHKNACLELYNLWAEQRKAKIKDSFYQGMLEDSLSPLKVLLDDYPDLNCIGKVVKISGQIKGFTFGFKLNSDTYCVLYEITDLTIKGLAQFIFREFCRELNGYKYINVMDDSGLENLKKVKLSYQPVRLIPSYIVQRK
ncbi:MAG: phosphatidylglycerol lysyltransferase domain-containing protein [Candidatus Omnitrophota bacterium]